MSPPSALIVLVVAAASSAHAFTPAAPSASQPLTPITHRFSSSNVLRLAAHGGMDAYDAQMAEFASQNAGADGTRRVDLRPAAGPDLTPRWTGGNSYVRDLQNLSEEGAGGGHQHEPEAATPVLTYQSAAGVGDDDVAELQGEILAEMRLDQMRALGFKTYPEQSELAEERQRWGYDGDRFMQMLSNEVDYKEMLLKSSD